MSTRAKGRKHEKEFEQILIDRGYIVELVKGSTKFAKSVDFFGLFDGFATSKKDNILFQIKTNMSIKEGGKSKLLLDIQEWAKNNPVHSSFKLMICIRYTKPKLKKKFGKWKEIIIL